MVPGTGRAATTFPPISNDSFQASFKDSAHPHPGARVHRGPKLTPGGGVPVMGKHPTAQGNPPPGLAERSLGPFWRFMYVLANQVQKSQPGGQRSKPAPLPRPTSAVRPPTPPPRQPVGGAPPALRQNFRRRSCCLSPPMLGPGRPLSFRGRVGRGDRWCRTSLAFLVSRAQAVF